MQPPAHVQNMDPLTYTRYETMNAYQPQAHVLYIQFNTQHIYLGYELVHTQTYLI